jgi:GTPase Era involved in 16S rRNA processing
MIEAPTNTLPHIARAAEREKRREPPPDAASGAADSEKLRAYTRTKLALAAQLRTLRDLLRQRGCESRLQQGNDLMAKLAEDRFTLAVVGQFKRGKSSLMNALIGRALLPVGALPLTSAITLLRFGPQERLLITRRDVNLVIPAEYPVERLAEFVTERENPGNRKQVKTACLELPVPFLRRGLEFVDTPGVGSAIEANTATTLGFLPDCDAVLFVTSVESPFSQAELEFLQTIRQYIRKVFFIVNKTDLLAPEEQREVLDFVRDTIRRQTGADNVSVFPVSSRLGLAAKLNGDTLAVRESGLGELKDALAHFLSDEKAAVFLAAITERALRLLQQESMEVQIQGRAKELPASSFLDRLETLTAAWDQCKVERQKIFERLRQRILPETRVTLMPELRAVVRSESGAFSGLIERVLQETGWRSLRGVLRRAERDAVRQLRCNIATWLVGHAERLSFASDGAARGEWERLQSNLRSLPAIAADIFGVRHNPNAEEELLPAWHLNPKFESRCQPSLQWHVAVPWPVAWLPVFLARNNVKRRLQKDSTCMVDTWQTEVITLAEKAVADTLDALAKEVEKRAAQICSRLLSVAKGEPSGLSSFQRPKPGPAGDPKYCAERLSLIRDHLLALRAELRRDPGLDVESPPDSVELPPSRATGGPAPRFSNSVADLQPTRPNLIRDLKTRGCPVCNHLNEVAFGFFSRFQYDLATDEETQRDFAEELGFCALHTWQLAAVSAPAGTSIGFAQLTEHMSQILAARAKTPGQATDGLKFVRESAECHVCRLLQEAEQDYLRHLARFVAEAEGRAAYARSQGICLRHLGSWLPHLPGKEIARFVLAEASRRLAQVAEDMQTFSMKREALRRDLQNTDETDAYYRAVIHLVGSKTNCVAWSQEIEL